LAGDQTIDDLKEMHKYANFVDRRLFIAQAITYTKHHGLFVIDRLEHACFKMTMEWPIISVPLGALSQHAHSIQHYLDLEAQKAKKRDRESMLLDEEEEVLRFRDEKGVILFRPAPKCVEKSCNDQIVDSEESDVLEQEEDDDDDDDDEDEDFTDDESLP
jgi:hypothetical protein